MHKVLLTCGDYFEVNGLTVYNVKNLKRCHIVKSVKKQDG